jgi:hypothetical protein
MFRNDTIVGEHYPSTVPFGAQTMNRFLVIVFAVLTLLLVLDLWFWSTSYGREPTFVMGRSGSITTYLFSNEGSLYWFDWPAGAPRLSSASWYQSYGAGDKGAYLRAATPVWTVLGIKYWANSDRSTGQEALAVPCWMVAVLLVLPMGLWLVFWLKGRREGAVKSDW